MILIADPSTGNYKWELMIAMDILLWFGYGKVNAHKAVQVAQERIKQELITEVITQENYTEMNIPDDDPTGISSVISIEENGTIKRGGIKDKY